jgi:lactaldehyde dehydrogenase/glycolaldehyde dehydrogenase
LIDGPITASETTVLARGREAEGLNAGWRKSAIGGADGKHGLYEFTQTHVVYLQDY